MKKILLIYTDDKFKRLKKEKDKSLLTWEKFIFERAVRGSK